MVRQIAAIAIDQNGQDLIEYALLAGFAAVAASALFPNFAFAPIQQIFQRLSSEITRITGV